MSSLLESWPRSSVPTFEVVAWVILYLFSRRVFTLHSPATQRIASVVLFVHAFSFVYKLFSMPTTKWLDKEYHKRIVIVTDSMSTFQESTEIAPLCRLDGFNALALLLTLIFSPGHTGVV